jgi:hypothetical protein
MHARTEKNDASHLRESKREAEEKKKKKESLIDRSNTN